MKKDTTFLGIIIIIIAVLLFAVSIPTAPDAFVDDYGTDYGAVLVLNFEEGTGATTFDQSPYGNDGQFSVAPSAPTWTTGKYGEAVNFTNSYVAVGNVSTSAKTIEFWAYLDTTTEPLFEFNGSISVSAVAGTLTDTGFTGTTTFYVDGVLSSTVTAETWHYIALTSDTDENCTGFNIGRVGASYLDGKADQLRIYTEEKTRGEIRNHYLNSGHMYSGSVIVSDDFRILNTTFGERIGLDDTGLNIHGSYVLYFPLIRCCAFDSSPGAAAVVIMTFPAGTFDQDMRFAQIDIALDDAPGADKWVNVTTSDGTNELTVSVTGAATSGSSTTTVFDFDVSAEAWSLIYSETAGAATTHVSVAMKYWYKENE